MNIQQFHRALTESDDPTIAALRKLREGDPAVAANAVMWFVWPAAIERSQTDEVASGGDPWDVHQRETAALSDWPMWPRSLQYSAALSDWPIWPRSLQQSEAPTPSPA